jgi:hypothetical protein
MNNSLKFYFLVKIKMPHVLNMLNGVGYQELSQLRGLAACSDASFI